MRRNDTATSVRDKAWDVGVVRGAEETGVEPMHYMVQEETQPKTNKDVSRVT